MASKQAQISLLGPRQPCQTLNPMQRGAIIALRSRGDSNSTTARHLQLNKATTHAFFKIATERNSAVAHTSPGAPRMTSERTDRLLRRTTKVERRMPLGELSANIVGKSPSRRTIQRRLSEAGIKKWIAKQRPRLTQVHASQRLAWARAHKNWTVDQWRRVIWSDECWVERSKDPRTCWVFRTATEKWSQDCINPKWKGPDAKIMIWAMFAGSVRGPIHIVEQTINGQYYTEEMLDEYLPQFYEELIEKLNTAPIFMHDNAPVHTSRLAKDWLDENGIIVMTWPPYSPDLNPIEHIWRHLKDQLHKMYPKLKDISSKTEAIKQLKAVIAEVWAEIEEEYFEALVASMPARCAAVIAARGWYTKY